MVEQFHNSKQQAHLVPSQQMSRHSEDANRKSVSPFGFLVPDVVHLWVANLELSAAELEVCRQILSKPEHDRSARFHFDVHRNRYVAAHGLLRWILSEYLLVPPIDLEFGYGTRGKPSIEGPGSVTRLEFNMAHSEDLALIAVGQDVPLGVDLERVRAIEDAENLVTRFFSKRESVAFERLPETLRPCAFFNLWTRKEAWLKATGEGIGHLLDQVEVSFEPSESAQLLALPAGYSNNAPWSIYDVQVKPGFAAALAVGSREIRTKIYQVAEFRKTGL